MKNKLRNAKFRTKITSTFLVIFVISVLLALVIHYTYSNRTILNNYRKNSSDMILQLDAHVNEKFSNLSGRIDALCNNMSFSLPLESYLSSEENVSEPVLKGNVADFLSELSMSEELVSSVYLYTEKGMFADYTQIPIHGVRYQDTEMYRHFVYYPSDSAAWFPAMENNMFQESGKVIPIVYRRVLSGNLLYFIVNLSQDIFEEYLKEAYSSFEEIFIVTNEQKEVVNYDEKAKQVLESFKYDVLENRTADCDVAKLEGEKYLITRTKMQGSDWQIYALTSVKSLMGDMRRANHFIILLQGLIMAAGIWALGFIARQLTRPLEQLAGYMDKSLDNHLDGKFLYDYRDEIGVLGNSYNEMMDEIRTLVEQLSVHIEALKVEKENVKQIQRQKRKAELAALQAQINPHFLYNTLNMITWQAVEQNATEISTISNALGRYFRISLSRGRELISIGEELNHVKSYLEIQKIRYKEKMDYEIDVPEDFAELFTLKLLLQPLVENALYHGIKEKEGCGCIQIYAGKGETDTAGRFVEFIVEDDGKGIEEERLCILNARLRAGEVDSESGYGIYNVNSRLRLYFGEEFGLRLESDSMGTRSIIRFPLLKTKEQTEDV